MSSGARELTGVRRAIRRVYQFYWASGLCDDVPAMSWFLITATVPLSLGIVAVASIVLGDAEQANAVARKLTGLLPRGARGLAPRAPKSHRITRPDLRHKRLCRFTCSADHPP